MKSRVALLSCLVLWVAPSPAQMYKWVDERGVTHYSEKPPPGRKAQQLQSAPASPASPSTPAGSQANPASTWNDQERDFRRRQIERDQAAEKKQKKEDEENHRAAMRRERCLDAQHTLAALNENRPVYWINQKGEREYIDDSARPAALQRAKQNVETYCKPE